MKGSQVSFTIHFLDLEFWYPKRVSERGINSGSRPQYIIYVNIYSVFGLHLYRSFCFHREIGPLLGWCISYLLVTREGEETVGPLPVLVYLSTCGLPEVTQNSSMNKPPPGLWSSRTLRKDWLHLSFSSLWFMDETGSVVRCVEDTCSNLDF